MRRKDKSPGRRLEVIDDTVLISAAGCLSTDRRADGTKPTNC